MENTQKLAVSVPEAAQMLGVSRQTAYALVNSSDFGAVRIGRKIIVPIAAMERWLNQSKSTGNCMKQEEI